MEKSVFAQRLQSAMHRLVELSRPQVDGVLPEQIQFRLLLNCSFDGHADPAQVRLYPDDSSEARRQALRACSLEQAVDELWRGGHIPEWIDARIVGETGTATCIELTCCGRFTADESRLYHQHYGHPPFSLKGADPLNSQIECLTVADLGQLPRMAHQVRELTLAGEAFDDATLQQLPDFAGLRRLTLRGTRVTACALATLKGRLGLEALCVEVRPDRAFDLHELTPLLALEILQVRGLAIDPASVDELWSRWPKLRQLTLTSHTNLSLDVGRLGAAAPALSGLELCAGGTLRITGQLTCALFTLRLQGHELALLCSLPSATLGVVLRGHTLAVAPRLDPVLDSVWVHLECAPPGTVERLLEGVQQLRTLHLQGTPMTEQAAADLVRRWNLQAIDLTDTGLDEAAARRLASLFPA